MRRRTRASGVAIGAALAAVTLAACGGAASSGGAAPGPAKVAAVIKGLDNPFFQLMQQGIEQESTAIAVTTTVQAATSTSDTTGQADKLTGLAGQEFGCYLVNPISGTNLVQGLAQIAAKGTPIVNIDSPVDDQAASAAGAKIATYIGTDNVAAGGLAAQQAAKLAPAGGPAAVIGGIPGDVTSGARIDGFTKGLPANIPVVQSVAANWERQEALTQTVTILRAHPDVKVIFAANDDMGLGAVRAVANEGKTGQVQVISVDGNPDALKSVAAGELAATVAQYPYAIGQMGVDACAAAARGATLPAKVAAPVSLITKDNAAQALAASPKPVGAYDNPFTALIK